MTLPALINTGLTTSSHRGTFHGPWEIGGSLYTILDRNGGSGLVSVECWKSTDGGNNWTHMDAANEVTFALDPQSPSAALDVISSTITVVFYDKRTTPEGIRVVVFDATTDTWGAPTSLWSFTGAHADLTTNWPHFVAVRAAGNYVVSREDPDELVMGTRYRRVGAGRFLSTVWTGVAVVGAGLQVHHDMRAILRVVDETWIFYTKSTGGLFVKRLTDANVLGAEETIVAAGSVDVATFYSVGHPIFYTNGGGATWVSIPYINATNLFETRTQKGATLSWTSRQISSVVEGTTSIAGALVADAAKLYALFSDAATDDMWLDTDGGTPAWGTDVEIRDAATIQAISPNKITNAIGIIYNDNGAVMYDQYSLLPPGKAFPFPSHQLVNHRQLLAMGF